MTSSPDLPVLIVGGSMGALRTAESLRKAGYAGPIRVIGEEPHPPYNRPPLSKDVLAEVVTHEAVAFQARPATADVEWLLGARATSLDLGTRTVHTSDGGSHEYGALVIATGLRPRRLPLDPLPGRHVVRTLDDAIELRAELVPGARVVVVGSGFIGCEVAATATKLGCTVTVVSPSSEPMVGALGEPIAGEVRRRHEQHGVAFVLGHTVADLTGQQRVEEVVLDDGTVLPADVVVEAIGAVVNDEWLTGSGLDTADGVLTDGALRATRLDGTVLDEVYVVGDIARFPNPMFDDVPRRVEHWNIPTDTGRRAGAVLAARLADDGTYEGVAAQRFAPMPSFWSNQFEVSLQAYGMPGLADPGGIRILHGDIAGDVIVGYHRGDRLVGVVGLGPKGPLVPYREQIQSGSP
jgi:3-phenylpropionate/trans-cinnamate dioxygenase ferredoxin reductase subunit